MMLLATDIGGSHLTSAIVDSDNLKTNSDLAETPYDAYATREKIISIWKEHFAQYSCYDAALIAIPGPIDYVSGQSQYKPNTKLGALSNDNIISLLHQEIIQRDVHLQLVNDAFSFAYGLMDIDPEVRTSNTICITLGTGLGSAIIHQGAIVPHSDLLYQDPLYDQRADDYFSTRWFTKYAENRYRVSCADVKELIETLLPHQVKEIFERFANQLVSFLQAYIRTYQIESLIIGGNIAKAEKFFGPYLNQELKSQNISLKLLPDTTDIILRGVASRYQLS